MVVVASGKWANKKISFYLRILRENGSRRVTSHGADGTNNLCSHLLLLCMLFRLFENHCTTAYTSSVLISIFLVVPSPAASTIAMHPAV